jgi:hypothetical protein
MKMKYYLSTIVGISLSMCASAQTYTHTAALPAVEKDGFYRIMLSPELGSFLSTDFANVRLFDKQNKEVPFLIDEEPAYHTTQQFHDYTIVEKKQKPGCCTSLILKNKDKEPINNISLVIKNAEVVKEATLLGSDDKKQWYALKQHFNLESINSATGTSEIKIVDFPLSNYVFYAIYIQDSTTAPLNIIKAGFYDTQTETGKYSEIPGLKFETADSAKEKSTYVHFQFDNPRFVDKIEMKLTGVPFYRRNAMLYEPKTLFRKKGKKQIRETYNEFIDEVELSSTHATTISFSTFKVKELIMVIENKDNPSLTVDNVKAYQLNRYITAWLKKNDTYTIRFGKDLQAPSYDLGFFRDSIPENTTILQAQHVQQIPVIKTTVESKTFFTNRIIIWIAIIAVIVVLGLMSVKMIRETNSKN